MIPAFLSPARSTSSRPILVALLAGTLFLITVPKHVSAQDLAEPPDSTIDQVLLSMGGQFIELSQAYDIALQNATAVRDAEAALLMASAAARGERGDFDPEVYLNADRRRAETPTASPFSGASVLVNTTGSGSAGVRSTLPFGTELDASIVGTRTETNSAFSALNPQYDTFGQLSVRQPLLAGGGIASSGQLKAARHLEESAEATLDDVVSNVLATVEELYWDLYAAERDYAVRRIIRSQAAALLNEAELRSRAGLVGPSQVENARVFLAEQQLAVIDREESLDILSDALSVVLGLRPDGRRFRPTDDPPTISPFMSTAEAVELALQSNSGLAAIEAQIRALETRLQASRRNRLPSIDLVGSIAGSGLSGRGRDVVFGSDTLRTANTGDLAEALSQVARFDFPTWEVGIDVRIPLTGRARNSEFIQRRAELDRLESRYEEARRIVDQQVRRSHRSLLHGTERLAIARRGVTASQEQVRIGLIAYRNGQTTAFEVVRLGADLAAAQQRYSQALVRTAKAAADLRRLTSGKFTPETTEQ